MSVSYIDKAKALREEAWREVQTSPSFLAFKALDDAVAAMGGQRLIAPREDAPRPSVNTFVRVSRETTAIVRKISQADAAEAVLRENGEPTPVGRLMEAAKEKGANIGGGNPLANFRSALSKDSRFYSRMRNGLYFWWLTGVELPENWQKAPDLLSEEGSDAFETNQKGGDDYAATMTH